MSAGCYTAVRCGPDGYQFLTWHGGKRCAVGTLAGIRSKITMEVIGDHGFMYKGDHERLRLDSWVIVQNLACGAVEEHHPANEHRMAQWHKHLVTNGYPLSPRRKPS